MGALLDREGRNQPIFIDFYEYHSVATENYSPLEDASSDQQQAGMIKDKGFLVRPNADGLVYGITHYAYKNNNYSFTGLVPQAYLGVANTWIECRLVKVFTCTNVTYPTIPTIINVGFTI